MEQGYPDPERQMIYVISHWDPSSGSSDMSNIE